jgi:hypothetical protein
VSGAAQRAAASEDRRVRAHRAHRVRRVHHALCDRRDHHDCHDCHDCHDRRDHRDHRVHGAHLELPDRSFLAHPTPHRSRAFSLSSAALAAAERMHAQSPGAWRPRKGQMTHMTPWRNHKGHARRTPLQGSMVPGRIPHFLVCGRGPPGRMAPGDPGYTRRPGFFPPAPIPIGCSRLSGGGRGLPVTQEVRGYSTVLKPLKPLSMLKLLKT